MEISINLVVSIVIGVAVLLILAFMANTYISGGEQTMLGWIPS
ncbi:MAG: hypothetical protein ABEJ56_06815 [Candidatus Nanohaloarchaea archaeon]